MSLTIAETAERTGLTAHTLGSFERDGLMLSVDRKIEWYPGSTDQPTTPATLTSSALEGED